MQFAFGSYPAGEDSSSVDVHRTFISPEKEVSTLYSLNTHHSNTAINL